MIKPTIIKINKQKYYSADELMEYAVIFFKGCKNARAILTKENIPEDDYKYAVERDDEWIESSGNSKKFDKLFLSKEWVEEHVPEYNEKEYEIKIAPDIIELKNKEKFKDNDGNIIEIEVRGIREFDKCYFKVKDIMEGFEIKRLNEIITDKRKNGYIYDVHYKLFNIQNYGADVKREKKIIKKTLFLTYTGLLRVLFVSHKKTADKFIKWASETLFTIQMGTKKQKNILISKMIGVSPETINAVFNKTSNKIPCIYLFYLGKVKDLRKSLNISMDYDDYEDVYKYGMTDDLQRRTKQHKTQTFKDIKNIDLQLVLFGFIDPQFISKAETKIGHLITGMDLRLENDNFSELAIIPKNKMTIIKEQYEMISQAYVGHINELIVKLKDKDNEIELLMKENELNEEKFKNELNEEKFKNELNQEKFKNELLKKDLEIMRLCNKSEQTSFKPNKKLDNFINDCLLITNCDTDSINTSTIVTIFKEYDKQTIETHKSIKQYFTNKNIMIKILHGHSMYSGIKFKKYYDLKTILNKKSINMLTDLKLLKVH
jgi:hypothetical protein